MADIGIQPQLAQQQVLPTPSQPQQVQIAPPVAQKATWGEVFEDCFLMGSSRSAMAASINTNDPKAEDKKHKLFLLKIGGAIATLVLTVVASAARKKPNVSGLNISSLDLYR